MNTIETVQALVARYETCAAETDAALRSARALLAQMQTEPIKAGSLDDALYSPDGSFGGAQSPTPVAPTFDEWWENHGKYNALFKFDHNASPSDRLARAKELMSLSWEVARESPAPVAVQPAALRMLTKDECHELAETVGLGSVSVQRKFCEVNNLGEPT